MTRLIVTLDGPAGSGKSTVARLLAQRLGLAFLDTGAMYRGITALCLDQGVDPEQDAAAAAALAREAHLRFDWSASPPRLHGDGRDLTHRLRDADVTAGVSAVAAIAEVRQVLVKLQRRIGQDHPRLVTEGRDQGSVVFPDAEVKFYLDATPQVRARRRAAELRGAGRDVSEQALLQQLLQRDHRDSHRSDGPLICPQDARRIDTTEMTLDEVVAHLEELVRQRVPHALSPTAP